MYPSIALVLLLAFQTNFSEQGMKALDEKRYPDAVDSLTQAIAADPKDYSLHFNLALAYSLMGKNAEAIPEYKKTLELKPDLYQAELNLGISLLREKQPAEAVQYLTAAAARRMPRNIGRITTSPRRCWARAISPKPSRLTRRRWRSIRNRPMRSWAWRTRWRGENKLEDAAVHFKKAAELNASYRDDLLELASMYETAKQPEQAMAIYQQFPENPGAQERLGDLLLKAGRPPTRSRASSSRLRNRPPKPIARRWPKRSSRTTNPPKRSRWWNRFSPPIRTISRSACCMDA